MRTFHAHGKLLLTGEYAVLDGALALALPVNKGQSLEITPGPTGQLHWESLDHTGSAWLTARFSLPDLTLLDASDTPLASRLADILRAARSSRHDFLQQRAGLQVRTRLDFPRIWGFGSSSTLLWNVACWAETNPYELLAATLGGSGYDIACAGADGPILYRLASGTPEVTPCTLVPRLTRHLCFVFLGNKQDSREGIRHYRSHSTSRDQLVETVSRLTRAFLEANDLDTLQAVMQRHEEVMAQALGLTPVKQLYFSDYWGAVKSLGAWGGDFVMAASAKDRDATERYFRDKGYETFFSYHDLALRATGRP